MKINPSPKRVASLWLRTSGRNAGLIEVPPKLLKVVTTFAIGQICLDLMESEVPGLPALAHKHAARTPKTQAIFPLEGLLAGWRYLRLADRLRAPGQTGSPEEVVFAAIPNRSRYLEVRLKYTPSGAEGMFMRPVYLTLYPKNLAPIWKESRLESQFRKFLVGVAGTIEHELIHYVQDLLREISGSQDAGLPSSRTPEYDQSLDRDYSHNESEAHRIHALDDREFYTRLKDEVRNFLRASKNIPDSAEGYDFWVRARKTFVADPSTLRDNGGTLSGYIDGKPADDIKPAFFFRVLRDAPGKWRKAVGEFLKATSRSAPSKPRRPTLPDTTESTYTGTDPATRDMISRPERYLQKDIQAFNRRWENAVESFDADDYAEELARLEKTNQRRIERGRKPREPWGTSPEKGWTPARQVWTDQSDASVVLGPYSFSPSPLFEVLKKYAPGKWKQMADDFMRRT